MEQSRTPRMDQLRRMLERTPDDPFLLYGVALEYKKSNDLQNALDYLDRALGADPGYCYAYYQKGQVYESQGDLESARRVYREGMEAARKKGDAHALSEIEGALGMIE